MLLAMFARSLAVVISRCWSLAVVMRVAGRLFGAGGLGRTAPPSTKYELDDTPSAVQPATPRCPSSLTPLSLQRGKASMQIVCAI